MQTYDDPALQLLFTFVLLALTFATALAICLRQKFRGNTQAKASASACNFFKRVKSFWLIAAVFTFSVIGGKLTICLLFAALSWLAMQEFLKVIPLTTADVWCLRALFFLVLPLNYFLMAMNWYGIFSVFVPVFALLVIPVCSALAGNDKNFLARTAEIQWGLLICVYFMSYAPALIQLPVQGEHHAARLLCFFVCAVQLSDTLQYAFGKLLGKHQIAPTISPNKTIEGFVLGILATVAIATHFSWLTPFQPWQTALMTLAATLCGFGGGLVMSAIKRDGGIKDFGTIIPGTGGIIDRIDSLCFAAPVFFHLTRHFFAH